MLAFFLATGVEAQISIDIDETQRIFFESGNFDIRRYSGEMQGVSYFVDNKLVMTADQIDLETDGQPDEGSFFVKSLEVINAEITGEDLRFSRAIARNVDFGVFLGEHSPVRNTSFDAGAAGFFDDSFLQVRGIEFSDELASVTVGNVETLDFVFDQLPTGERYARNGGLLIDDLRFDLGTVKPEFKELADTLGARGLRAAEFDFAVSQIANFAGGELRTEHAFNLVMDEMASLELVSGFEIKLATLVALDSMATQGRAKESEMLNLIGGIELASLNATYLDDGLVDTLVDVMAAEQNVSPAEMRSSLRLMLPQTLEEILPRNGRRMARPLETLLKQGGGLEVSVRPQQPVILSNFLGFLIMPDLALEQLGVTITHLRDQ
ncbi:hypothetical protein OBA45_00630 [bacterium]|nr:hypothetical protein [bacterium]